MPEPFRSRISVIYDGNDTQPLQPYPLATLELRTAAGTSQRLSRDQSLITFVNRNLEPYRGYYMFMRAQPAISDADLQRVHWFGRIPYDQFVAMLQISSVHVYLTVPLVLSWSLLEAMSIGCAIVASDTEPVREVISHDHIGDVNFFDAGC